MPSRLHYYWLFHLSHSLRYSRAGSARHSRQDRGGRGRQRNLVSALLTQIRSPETLRAQHRWIFTPRAMKNLLPKLRLFTAAVLVLLLLLLPSLNAAEDEYYIWKTESYDRNPQCMDIPEDLRLCFNVGYKQMLLPNLLEHESIAEVKQQAGSWVPLVHKACHPGTQVFLCSLFAPVCLDRPIYPCRWLCEAVRDSCIPIMQAFGFPWPDMLRCDKFPEGDVCISMNNTSSDVDKSPGVSSVCPPCDNEMNSDAILEHMCGSEFAIKTKIKEVKIDNLDRKITLQKKRKVVKLGNLKKDELKKLVLYLKNGADCPCQQLENLRNGYLIMGRKVGTEYILTGIHKWDKSSKEFKKALKKLKSHTCPVYETVFK